MNHRGNFLVRVLTDFFLSELLDFQKETFEFVVLKRRTPECALESSSGSLQCQAVPNCRRNAEVGEIQ